MFFSWNPRVVFCNVSASFRNDASWRMWRDRAQQSAPRQGSALTTHGCLLCEISGVMCKTWWKKRTLSESSLRNSCFSAPTSGKQRAEVSKVQFETSINMIVRSPAIKQRQAWFITRFCVVNFGLFLVRNKTDMMVKLLDKKRFTMCTIPKRRKALRDVCCQKRQCPGYHCTQVNRNRVGQHTKFVIKCKMLCLIL